MKSPIMTTRRFAAFAWLFLLSQTAQAATLTWTANSGSAPDSVGFDLINTSAPELPTLSASDLTISNDSASEIMLYSMSAASLDFPSITEISFTMVVDSGSTLNNARGPAAVGVTTSANVGVILWIGLDEILTNTAPDGRGPANTSIDTDDGFHSYLIRLDGTSDGGAVSVFQDSSLVLSTTLNTSAGLYGSEPRITFGEGTGFEFGTSRWQDFSHNALQIPEPSSAFFVGLGLLALWARRR